MDEGGKVILHAKRDYESEKSEVIFNSLGVKHYHLGDHFSYIDKKNVKEAFLANAPSVDGFLSNDNEEEKSTPYAFRIHSDSDGTLKVGCLLFSRDQVKKIRKWVGVK